MAGAGEGDAAWERAISARAAMAGAGEDDAAWERAISASAANDAVWERAISAAVKSAPLTPFSAPKTLTLDYSVKSSIGRLPSSALFDRFPSLEELSVAGARLSSLAGLPRLPALLLLFLPDNRLSGAESLAAVAESCGRTLRRLDLGNNRFAEVDELAPLAPLRVEALDLYQCPVTKVKGYREKVFKLIPSLKYLDGVDAEGNERLETDEEEVEEREEDWDEYDGDEEEHVNMVDTRGDLQQRSPLELLDPSIDGRHRSRKSAVEGIQLGVFRTRTANELLTLDPRWIDRLRLAGLLPLCRMIEASAREHLHAPRKRDDQKRFCYDKSLLAALVDRWRPETHTFHLAVGEMAPTLQDVSFLLGLPCAGAPVVAVEVSPTWHADLQARFGGIVLRDGLPKAFSTTQTYGPPKRWLLQFTAENIHPDADEATVSRHLEAYLLWLFGWVMFTSGEGHAVDKQLISYAREIADSPLDQIPSYSWASAVLAATYRALCDSCLKTREAEPVLSGCPLLLQMWSYERFPIGRPLMDHNFYGATFYHSTPEDKPTMGFLWFRRRGTWAHLQSHRDYPGFTWLFDELQDTDVVWTPYTPDRVKARAPLGLSSLCQRDSDYWLTTRPVLFDIFVEEYSPHRVMRQFGLRQQFPLPLVHTVPTNAHMLTRRGQNAGHLWAPMMQPWVERWKHALEERIEEDRPYKENTYPAYMRWYFLATRTRVGHTPATKVVHVASVTDMSTQHRAQASHQTHDLIWECNVDAQSALHRLHNGIQMTTKELIASFERIQEKTARAIRLSSCRTVVDVPRPKPRSLPQMARSTTNAPGVQAPRMSQGGQPHFSRASSSSQGTSLRSAWRPQFNQTGLPSQVVPTRAPDVRDWDSPEVEVPVNQDKAHFDVDEPEPTQLTGAPPLRTQLSQPEYVIPQAQGRAQQDVGPPDRSTFPSTRPPRGQGRGRRRGLHAEGAVRGIRPKRARA